MEKPSRCLRVVFVMEQHLGHYTYYQNLRRIIDTFPSIDARWIEVTYEKPGSWINSLPLSKRIRGPLVGRDQIIEGLRSSYDVAFFNTQVPAALAGWMIRQRPYILSTDITPIQYDQMSDAYGHQPDNNKLVGRLKYKINQDLFKGAAKIVPWSTWVRDSLEADYGVPPDRIQVTPPGIDLDHWPVHESGEKDIESASRPMRILFVGGQLNRKGGDILLEAFHRLPPGMAELHLVTRTSIDPSPGVSVYSNLTPNSPQLLELYSKSDVFALPTRAEAFGIAAVEGAAAGLPVIATAVGGLTDIIVDRETGYLIPPGDAQALADCLHKLANNPQMRRQMGQAGRARIEAHFNALKNTERIVNILMEVGGTKR